MDVKSLNEYIKSPDVGLHDLFVSTFIYDTRVELSEYTTGRDDEMRIDLIYQKMYNLESTDVGLYLQDIDVILFINGISNPLNIIEGIVIKYPTNQGDIGKFRVLSTDNDMSNKDKVRQSLVFVNKSTVKDKSRQEFIKDGYSLPPVVLDVPRSPVSIKNGKFSIGGLQ